MADTDVRQITQVSVRRDGCAATVTLSNENGLNVFSSGTVAALGNVVDAISKDASLRVVVFRGKGKAFVAGADISEMVDFNEDQGHAFSQHGHHVFDTIEALPQVTIAAINGHAMGGGAELALACDFRVMAAGGRIGLPECRLGLLPGWGGTLRLTRLVGPAWAKRLMFTGDGLTAQQAHEIGLVDEVVPGPEQLDAALEGWFKRLTPGAPAAVRRIKHAMIHGDEIHQFMVGFSCTDAHEGMRAFLEKRPPRWTSWDCRPND